MLQLESTSDGQRLVTNASGTELMRAPLPHIPPKVTLFQAYTGVNNLITELPLTIRPQIENCNRSVSCCDAYNGTTGSCSGSGQEGAEDSPYFCAALATPGQVRCVGRRVTLTRTKHLTHWAQRPCPRVTITAPVNGSL